MDAKDLDPKCVKCPVQLDVKYDQSLKTKVLVEINSKNKFISIRIKDEYSISKDIDRAIEGLLDKSG